MSCATPSVAPVRAHAVAAPAAVRSHRRDVARWALASGRPAHRDALAALVGARADTFDEPSAVAAASVWTAVDVGALLWTGVQDWCEANGARSCPAGGVADTLDTYLRYLCAHRLLARGSDPVATLRRAVTEYGGGRSQRHPSLRRAVAPVVPIA